MILSPPPRKSRVRSSSKSRGPALGGAFFRRTPGQMNNRHPGLASWTLRKGKRNRHSTLWSRVRAGVIATARCLLTRHRYRIETAIPNPRFPLDFAIPETTLGGAVQHPETALRTKGSTASSSHRSTSHPRPSGSPREAIERIRRSHHQHVFDIGSIKFPYSRQNDAFS
jgi:hypothetical protein